MDTHHRNRNRRKTFARRHRRAVASLIALSVALISGGMSTVAVADGVDDEIAASIDGVPGDAATLDELQAAAPEAEPTSDPAADPEAGEPLGPPAPEPDGDDEGRECPDRYSLGLPAPPSEGAARETEPRETEPLAEPIGFAHIDVRAGGVRALGTVTDVVPLPGATFRLSTAVRSGTTAAFRPGVPVEAPWASATSGADGVARFEVPVVALVDGTETASTSDTGSLHNRGLVSAEGATAGARFFVVQTAAPDGWSVNDSLRTGGTSAGGTSRTTPYTFLTAGVAVDGRQVSGDHFMNADGVNRSDFAGGAGTPSSAVRTQSNGVWQNVRANPAMPPQCGIGVALVVDMSSSVGAAHRQTMTGAAQAFVNALTGTPSYVSSYSFGWTAPSSSVPTDAHLTRQSVASEAGRQAFVEQLARWRAGGEAGAGSEATNWNRGFAQVAEANANRPADQRYDYVFFITDGNPTWFLDGGTGTVNNRLRDVEEGIFSANLVKSQGTRVVAVGVGGPTFLDEISMANLHAVSGPARYDAVAGSDGRGILDADVIRVTEWGHLAAALSRFAIEGCTPSLNVNKVEAPHDAGDDITVTSGQVTAPSVPGGRDGAGWDMTAALTGQSLAFPPGSPDPMTRTTDDSGAVTFPLVPDLGAEYTSVRITETQQPGWRPVTQGGRSAFCSYRTFRGGELHEGRITPTAEGVDDGGNPFVELAMHREWMVSCQFVNKQPPPPVVTGTMTEHVDHDWRIEKSADRHHEWARPGQGAEFVYTLTVTAVRQVSPRVADLALAFTNPGPVGMALAGVTASVDGGTAVPVVGPDLVGPGATVTVTIPGVVIPSTATSAQVTVDLPGLPPSTHDVPLAQVAGDVTHGSARVTDSWSPWLEALAGAWHVDGGAVLLAFPETLPEGEDSYTWVLTYTARKGTELGEGVEDARFPNVATVTPEGGEEPAGPWNDPQDDGDLTDDETVLVSTGRGLTVAGALWLDVTRVFPWDLEKEVLGDSVLPAGADGTATFRYRVTVTPLPMVESMWQVRGEVVVHNPNAWCVDVLSVTSSPLVLGAACALDGPGTARLGAGATRTFAFTCTFDAQPVVAGSTTATIITWDPDQAFSAAGTAFHVVDTSRATLDTVELGHREIVVLDDFAGHGPGVAVVLSDGAWAAGGRQPVRVEPGVYRLGTATWNDDGVPTSFDYWLTVPAPSADDVDGSVDHVNTAWIAELPEIRDDETVRVVAVDVVDLAPGDGVRPPVPSLPVTGSEALLLVLGALLAIGVGVGLRATARRRSGTSGR
ncbi:vWA domain-containing protein [Xylanimonas protaetiae]|uniref:VWFA domain-containing protein n=1 Tax=Xylanimonas protaetiae TaxID=2509457 RepID=A0A4P6F4M1_9MICO|nr:vWA domain-containing protein [Xylanimonas protaetiae]QAY69663.1 hypothetical protein ET471_06085 [Xylanimonas protaetiae]